ncbi:MAG TPA: tetratricopeptide repeat protein [Leptospiraceae bacterium]|nr:tetratricopeptide repeat protein [Leptospirales bacterium]HMU83556.1 tetratricopeptide repeat protein [Leptospiraceae bacterium]HMW60861.1 tetratricopeptide repeat protein [Leptospiraceae bacterium]HMX55433.1 tetratricopeptide repeat protein [Leptospiraceae bacterium]HNE22594.1 tetratricopeptide repeat protein [Leptospiraceae bacterium]
MRYSFFLLFLSLAVAVHAAPSITPESMALYHAGHSAAVSGDRAAARGKFDAALARDPKNFLAMFDIGGLAEDAGRKEEAIEAYEKTTAIAPDFAEAQVELGTLYLNVQRNPDKAIARFRIALLTKVPYADSRFALSHTRGQALRNLSVSYAVKRQFGLAQGIARSFLSDSGVNHEGDAAMNTLLQRSSGSMTAVTTRKFAEDLEPISKQLHGGKVAEALSAYLAFEKSHPLASLPPMDAWDLYEGIGLAYAMTNRNAEALVAFEKAVEAGMPLPYGKLQEAQFNTACALALLGRAEEAIARLEEVLWEDQITTVDPERTRKNGYAPLIKKDETLASIRQHPGYLKLFETYGP